VDQQIPQAQLNVNLQTLIATLLQGVQAQNLIATNIKNLTAAAFPVFTSSATWNPPNLASGSSETQTITMSGVTLGMVAIASFSLDLQGLSLTAYVSASDTVTVVLSNLTGGAIDLGSGTLKVKVFGA